MRSNGESLRTSEYNEILNISKVNETFVKIDCTNGVAQELGEYFSFFAPNYKFMPAYKNKFWDGKIRLFNLNNRTIYAGLVPYIKTFCNDRDYFLEIDQNLEETEEFSLQEGKEFAEALNLPYEARDYQVEALAHAVRTGRSLILSPTASGKSLIIYLIYQYYQKKTLLIVPTVSLVHQMKSDFADYSVNNKWPVQRYVRTITGESAKDWKEEIDEPLTITTWQSIYKMPKAWFDQFEVVIGDEAHLFKAKSLTDIMTKLSGCKYRFGFTGTLDGTDTHKLILEGLFGTVRTIVKTKDLIDAKHLAELTIKILMLRYTDEICKANKDNSYQNEIDFIVSNEKRNKFITNLTVSLEGNTLLLFQYVDKHGRILYDMIKQKISKDRKVFFVFGGTDAETRESVRAITEKEASAIIIASYGTFSTGVNIRNLHNVIFASPGKSKIRNLQSIGRGLRKGNNKDACVLYDIADDLHHNKRMNYTLKHLLERIKTYNEEGFDYKMYKIKLG